MSFSYSIFDFFSRAGASSWWSGVSANIFSFLDWLRPYSSVFSLILLTGIVYCFLRIERIVEETFHDDHAHEHEHGAKIPMDNTASASRFERVQKHIESDKESDWRLAILEADVLLDEMVTGMGYRGDSLGEKLKGIEKSDFTELDKAWEAHTVRNRIAHEGAAFTISEREARRVIGLYEDVFREFHFV